MSKAVKELTVVFDELETDSLVKYFHEEIKRRAVRHFVENEGMDKVEAIRRVETQRIWFQHTDFQALMEGAPFMISRIKVDVDLLNE